MHADRLGRYEIVRHLASGGMASVYLARVTGVGGFQRHVVLKTIRDDQADASVVPMFLDEARIIATLHHQHIAQVYEVGHAEGSYYLAMEYVHGETVRAVLETAVKQGHRLPLEFGLTVTCAAASGLHHAHERRDVKGTSLGIVHRDVTPSNVLVSYDGSIKVIDFGIAKAAQRTTRTSTGFIKGKAGYMAPEQVKGYPVDRRSDVFALGVLAYETTTQKRAFHAETQFEQMEQIAKGRIQPPSALVPRYPLELESIVMRALELDPDDRYPDASSFRTDLERVARGLGLTLGPDSITHALDALYGPRPEPWLVAPGEIDYDLTPPVVDLPLSIEVLEESEKIVVAPPAIARGSDQHEAIREDQTQDIALSEVEVVVEAVAEAPPVRPTRVHRSTMSMRSVRPSRRAMIAAATVAAACFGAIGYAVVTRDRGPDEVVAVAPEPAAPVETHLTVPPPVPPPPPPSNTTDAPVPWPPFLALASSPPEPVPAPAPPKIAQAPKKPVPPPAPAAPKPAPRVAIATKTPPPKTVEKPPKSAATTPGHVMLHVVTDPSDATVVLDGVRLGRSPFHAEVPVRGQAWLKVRRFDRLPVGIHVVLDRDVTWNVKLPPKPATPATPQ